MTNDFFFLRLPRTAHALQARLPYTPCILSPCRTFARRNSTSDLTGPPSTSSGAEVKRTIAPQPMIREPSCFTRSTVSSIALPLRMISSTIMHAIHFSLIHVLTKHAFALFLFCPINLFGVECITHTESYGNPARTRTDYRHLGQLAGDVFFEPKLSAQCDSKHTRRVVIAKRQRHLKIMWRVFAVGINKVAFAKRACALSESALRYPATESVGPYVSPISGSCDF